jgi:hypothetical protein
MTKDKLGKLRMRLCLWEMTSRILIPLMKSYSNGEPWEPCWNKIAVILFLSIDSEHLYLLNNSFWPRHPFPES